MDPANQGWVLGPIVTLVVFFLGWLVTNSRRTISVRVSSATGKLPCGETIKFVSSAIIVAKNCSLHELSDVVIHITKDTELLVYDVVNCGSISPKSVSVQRDDNQLSFTVKSFPARSKIEISLFHTGTRVYPFHLSSFTPKIKIVDATTFDHIVQGALFGMLALPLLFLIFFLGTLARRLF